MPYADYCDNIDEMLVFLSVALSALAVACLGTYILARPGGLLRIMDQPNERSLHTVPVPRTGGLAIWLGALAGISVALVSLGTRVEFAWIGAGAMVVGAVSLMDDRFRLPAGLRLIAHIVAAVLLLAGGLGLRSLWFPDIEFDLHTQSGLLLSLLFVVWMTNLYNFMDGMDGFAAGMALIGFGTFALFGAIASEPLYLALNLAAAAAAAGFLVFNFPPARIFMGDTGSSTLGLLAAASILWADRDRIFPLWMGLLVFAPFIVDATVTLVRRILRRDRIWTAHKTHYYQRLVDLGLGHKRTTVAEYALMILGSVSVLGAYRQPESIQWGIIVFWIACYAVLMLWVDGWYRRATRPAANRWVHRNRG